jgi:outer membrane protein TolC
MLSEIIKSNRSILSPDSLKKQRKKSPFEGGLRGMTQTLILYLNWTIILFPAVFVLGITQNMQAQEHPSPGSNEAVEDSLALEQYVQQALENSPRIEALFQQYYARLEQIPQVGTLPEPEVMFQYHINPMERGNILTQTTVSAKQMFPWFGTLGKRKEWVEKLSHVEWTAFEEARNELAMEVKEQWYWMHELHHHLIIFRHNLELLERLERQVRSQYESGRASQLDLLRLQIEQENLRTQIENSEEELKVMKIRFNALLDRKSNTEIKLSEVMFNRKLGMSEESIRRTIYDRNPRLREREFKEEAALAAEEQARLEGRPSFGLGLMAMNRNYMYMPLMGSEGPALTGSLTIRLPLYRSKYRAQQKQAQIEARAAREERRDIFNLLNAEAESLLQQYRDAGRRIALYEERLIPKTRQALEVALSDYSSGRADFEQIIQLQQQLLDYEMKLNAAYVKQNIATAEIEYLSGKYNMNPEEIEIEGSKD